MLDHNKDIHEASTVESFDPLMSTSPKKAPAAMTAADSVVVLGLLFHFFLLQVLTREPGNKFLDVLGAGNIKKHPLETQMLASYVQTNPIIYGL